jgi:hypothetical protein
MHMRFLSLLLFATTATVVPAQNLPAWSKWIQINPGYQRIYSATPSRITFNPYCSLTKCGNPVRTGITQTSDFKVDGWNCVPPLSATSFGSRSWF